MEALLLTLQQLVLVWLVRALRLAIKSKRFDDLGIFSPHAAGAEGAVDFSKRRIVGRKSPTDQSAHGR